MKLATWNVNSLAVRLPQVLDWLLANPVDALVLQETKLTDDKFPHAEIEAAGYAVQFHGQKTYNGVALLSRGEALDVVKNIPGLDDAQARVIAGTVASFKGFLNIFFIGLYFFQSERYPHAYPQIFPLRAQSMALGGSLLSPSYKRWSARVLGCAGSASCGPQRRRVHLERKRLATLQQDVKGLSVVQKQTVLNHALVVLGQRLPRVAAGCQIQCAGDRSAVVDE